MYIKKKNRKILYIEPPILRCYPSYAAFWAILGQNSYDLSNIADSYIQIIYNKSTNRVFFNNGLDILRYISNFPLSENYCYSRNILKQQDANICEFLIMCINDNQYLHFLVDTYYIKEYELWYQNEHVLHNITIYGYDINKKVFFCADCFVHGIFGFAEVTFDQIIESNVNSENDNDWLEGIHSWKLKENVFAHMQYNIQHIKQNLVSFIESTPTKVYTTYEENKRTQNDFVYGISAYDEISQYFRICMKCNEKVDIRTPFVLFEQIKNMNYICKQLNRNNLINNYSDFKDDLILLEKQIDVVVKLCVKYNMVLNESIILNIIEKLELIKIHEIEIIGTIISFLNTTNYEIDTTIVHKNLKNMFHLDAKVQGDWHTKYGIDGYDIIGDKIQLPYYIDENYYKYKNANYVSVLRNYGDKRALSRSKNHNQRPVAFLLSDTKFSVEIKLSGSDKRFVSLYFVDYDNLNREEIIQVLDKVNNFIIEEVTINNFTKGIYINFKLSGWIEFIINRVSGPNAVLSGIFFDTINE